jgi:ankyrin repeat protein/acyl-CoA-binding protein
MPIASASETLDRNFEERLALLNQTRLRLRNSWRNDPKVLKEYFGACIGNWKAYKGERKAEDVLRLHGIYRQATQGDCNETEPTVRKGAHYQKWLEWFRLKGTTQEVAMRRFITFLAEVNPILIDVMPAEKPPPGFPMDNKGQQICAKCNTRVGCQRPLLNQYNIELRQELFENDHLHDKENLRAWVSNAMVNQRCVFGVHKSVAKADIKPFQKWFDRSENGGYDSYNAASVVFIVRELVEYQYQIVWDMQCNKDEYHRDQYNDQALKVASLSEVYTELTGEKYTFEVPCIRTNDLCEQRRVSDGRNHTHPVELDPPTQAEDNTHAESVQLRIQCKDLGLSQSVGVERNIARRCDIYRARISEHFERLQKCKEATSRLDSRIDEHKAEKAQIKMLAGDMNERQIGEACNNLNLTNVLALLRRGANSNAESVRGMTPLLCAILCNAKPEQIDLMVHKYNCNIDHVTKNGMTPLIVAVRLRDRKMLYTILRNNASVGLGSGKKGRHRNVMHWCAVHGCDEEAGICYEYLKEKGGDSLRLAKLLDTQDADGNTPLMLTATWRAGLMARCLISLGANPNLRSKKAQTAAYMARHAGWIELADWLDKKVGSGVSKIETYSDVTYEKKVRFESNKLKDKVHTFGAKFLILLLGGSGTDSPLGPPSTRDAMLRNLGDRAKKQMQDLSNNQARLFHHEEHGDGGVNGDGTRAGGYLAVGETTETEKEQKKELRHLVSDMVALCREGYAYPNTESKEKPLPWTALGCAAAINDLKAMKKLLREGADPNYPNLGGTTPLMVASQLNNLEAIVELLIAGGDPLQCDTEGFSAMAYANAFPPSEREQVSAASSLLDGDNSGNKRLTPVEVIQMAIQYGAPTIRIVMRDNLEETKEEIVEAQFAKLRLLEKNGLTRVDTERQLQRLLKTVWWRVGASTMETETYDVSDDSEEERDQEELKAYLAELEEAKRKEREAAEAEERAEGLKCPICTLPLPCSHFRRPEAVKKHMEKKALEDKFREAELAMRSYGNDDEESDAREDTGVLAQRLQSQKYRTILSEAGLDNRNSDRSIELSKKYGQRDREVGQAKAERERRARLEATGEWAAMWQESVDQWGRTLLYHPESKEKWTRHMNPDGKAYFHNEESGETVWDSPITGEEEVDLAAVANAEAQRQREAEEEARKKAALVTVAEDGSVTKHIVESEEGQAILFHDLYSTPESLEAYAKEEIVAFRPKNLKSVLKESTVDWGRSKHSVSIRFNLPEEKEDGDGDHEVGMTEQERLAKEAEEQEATKVAAESSVPETKKQARARIKAERRALRQKKRDERKKEREENSGRSSDKSCKGKGVHFADMNDEEKAEVGLDLLRKGAAIGDDFESESESESSSSGDSSDDEDDDSSHPHQPHQPHQKHKHRLTARELFEIQRKKEEAEMIGPNPVPVSGRTVMMFSAEHFGREQVMGNFRVIGELFSQRRTLEYFSHISIYPLFHSFCSSCYPSQFLILHPPP